MKMDSAKRVIAGTWGTVWMDGEQVAECYGCQAKISADKETVSLCGRLMDGHKVMGLSGSGSLKLHKVNSRMGQLLGEAMKKGTDPRFTIVTKLDDPDAYGAERVSLSNVSFDDLTLVDFEAKQLGKVECPFTFEDFEYLDMIQA